MCNEEAAGANVPNPQKYCTCSYEAIVDTIPFDEFKEINSELSDEPGPLPKKMLDIRDECRRTTSSG